ncbi:camp-regulated phosphoprotein family protein [Botrytis cinerea]
MNPLQKNKIDIASLSPDEQRLFRLYGKLPSKADHLAKQLKERKYFDSGDYALSKAGKASSVDTGSVGSEHPLPENIPISRLPALAMPHKVVLAIQIIAGLGLGQQSGSPVKESSYLHRETSIDEADKKNDGNTQQAGDGSVSPPVVQGGIPING